MWNYEHSGTPRFEHSLSSGPTPGSYWLALFLLIDDTCTVISSPDSHRITIDNIEKIANNPTEQDLAELTAAEKAVILGWVKLRALASKALFGTDIAAISPDISDLQTWLSALAEPSLADALKALSVKDDGSKKKTIPLQSDIQSLFLLAELLQACARLCDAASRLHKNKAQKWWQQVPVKELAALRGVAQDVFAKAVRQPALDWTNALSERGVQELAEGAKKGKTGEKVLEVLGEGAERRVQDVAGLLVQGATDGLDGVLKVKLA